MHFSNSYHLMTGVTDSFSVLLPSPEFILEGTLVFTNKESMGDVGSVGFNIMLGILNNSGW